jgi:hypothetical protein
MIFFHSSSKNWGAMRECIIDFKKAYDEVRREVLYCILTEFGVTTKVFRLLNVFK